MNGHWHYQQFASIFSRIYSSKHNPFYHFGSISVLLLIIAAVSGIYIFLFYEMSPTLAYSSTEEISKQLVGGVMRSIHRYSSDALVIFVVLHLIHMLITGKFRRALSWVTGVVSLWILWIIGLTGFIMVWDHKAKLISLLTAKLFSALPIFSPAIAGGFLLNDLSSLSGFFRVTLFGHLALSILTLILLWVHVIRVAKPRLLPTNFLIGLCIVSFLIIALIFPVKSDPPAQDTIIPYQTSFDWYFLFGFYFMKIFSSATNLLIILASIVLFVLLACVKKPFHPPAKVDLSKCEGCSQCYDDCPYNAISMMAVNGEIKSILDPSKCVGCGICVASCKSDAITIEGLPDFKNLFKHEKKEIAVLTCRYMPVEKIPQNPSVTIHQIPCVGDIHADNMQEWLGKDVKGLMLVSCEDCYYRFGKDIERQRFIRKRRPTLSRKISLERIRLVNGINHLEQEMKQFVKEVQNADYRKSSDKLQVREFSRPSYFAAIAIWLLVMLSIPLLSSKSFPFYSKDHGVLVFNFKYNSTAITVMEESTSALKHMQSSVPIATKRAEVKMEVFSDGGKLFYSKIFKARGLHEDMAAYIYDEISFTGIANIKLTEVEFPQNNFELKRLEINKGKGTVIGFENGLKISASK